MASLFPKDTSYFDVFEKLAQHALNAAKLLSLVAQSPAMTGIIRRIHDEEMSKYLQSEGTGDTVTLGDLLKDKLSDS